MKTKKTYYFIAVIVVLVAVGAFFYQKTNRAVAPLSEMEKNQSEKNDKPAALNEFNPDPSQQATTAPASQPAAATLPEPPSKPVYSDGSEMEGLGPDILVTQVDYDGSQFSPAVLNIKAGDIVFFKNSSQSGFWPASDPHPTHTAYPEFDAKKAVPAGSSFQFKFLKAGNWGYHDHFNPSAKGQINVTQ